MKKESLILGKLLKKIAPRIGAKVFLEPEWGIAGMITFKNGKHSFFRYNTMDVNPIGASDIAKDKDYANTFMKRLGYSIVPGSKTFFSDDWALAVDAPKRKIGNAYHYATELGFPVVIKPNSGSQGTNVSFVQNKKEFYAGMKTILERDHVALVQKPVSGKDYRVVVLDDKIISAYERIPLNVVGDGRSSILSLLKKKQQEFSKTTRDTRIKFKDPRIANKLKRVGMSLSFVPLHGERVYVLDNANLSTGGDSIDVTDRVHTEFKELAIQLTKDMGLRLCGVDLMIAGDISEKPNKFWILEINAAPGLDHYSKSGKRQEKIVEDLYLEVLKSIAK